MTILPVAPELMVTIVLLKITGGFLLREEVSMYERGGVNVPYQI